MIRKVHHLNILPYLMSPPPSLEPELESMSKIFGKELSETKHRILEHQSCSWAPEKSTKLETSCGEEESRVRGAQVRTNKISSTLEAAQILTIVASEGFKGSLKLLLKGFKGEKGKAAMTEEETFKLEVQALKTSKELQEQIDLDALLARRLEEQEDEAAERALATEFDSLSSKNKCRSDIL
ncbi:hypothetical protein Tco_0868229 [Tanacetum coccineum]